MAWPKRRYNLEADVPLPRHEVWELLADTDRLNRYVGLAPVQVERAPLPGTAGVREAQARLGGLVPMRWKEYPWQWVKNERYAVTRLYDQGPLQRFEGGLELEDAPISGANSGAPGTRLNLFAEITPANPLGALIGPVAVRRSMQRTLEYCREAIRLRHQGVAQAVPPMPHSPVDAAQLERLLEELSRRPIEHRHIPALGQFLREGGDTQVMALRPFELAQEWGAEPDEVLRLCLHATRAGLLNLSWNLMCPNCRVPVAQQRSLAEVSENFHCDYCGVTYDANFDRYMELRFAVHPAVRQAVAQTYCFAGPFAAPHAYIQQPLPAGGQATVAFPTSRDAMRLRVLRAKPMVLFEPASLSPAPVATLELVYDGAGWSQEVMPAPPPGTPVHLVNRSEADVVLVLEKVDWDPLAATAAKVTTLQEFRDLFSSEVLRPGQHVGIESLTLFFSDLRDSTALYEQRGDAPAYSRVRDHFDYLFGWIGTHSGSIVKTIGDAVMAVFYTPEDAVRAALEIQRGAAAFNATLPENRLPESVAGERAIVIKIGLHSGCAIAINSNDRLDYFGRTVNVAARLAGASQGDDIVLSSALFDRPGVQVILREFGAGIERFSANLKGVEGVTDLYRVRLVEPEAPGAR